MNLLEVLLSLHGVGDERLHLQIDVFHEEAHRDAQLSSTSQGRDLDLDSHAQVFQQLYNSTVNSPQASILLNVLRGMLLLDAKDPNW